MKYCRSFRYCTLIRGVKICILFLERIINYVSYSILYLVEKTLYYFIFESANIHKKLLSNFSLK